MSVEPVSAAVGDEIVQVLFDFSHEGAAISLWTNSCEVLVASIPLREIAARTLDVLVADSDARAGEGTPHNSRDNWRRNTNAELELTARGLERLAKQLRDMHLSVDANGQKTFMELLIEDQDEETYRGG